MASSSRVFSQSFKLARIFKSNSSKVQALVNSAQTTISARKLSNAQLARPLASVSGFLNGGSKYNLKSKLVFAPQVSNVSLVTRSAAFLSPASEGADESSVSTSEGSDSSCEAMEGPHSDDDGLVISNIWTSEDL